MNDEELPISAELASAYLDGELDAAERDSVAADPDVMAMVASFARVRATLGRVEPAAYSTRTAAVAAALAEFDARNSAPDVVPAAAKVTSLHSRRMGAYRILTGVAAAAVVGVIAVAALNSSSGDDANSTTAFEAPAGQTEDATAAQPDLKVAADAAGAAPADTAAPAGDQTMQAASAAPAIDSEDALARYATELSRTNAATAPAAEAATTSAASDAGVIPSQPTCLDSNHIVLGSIVYQGTPAYAVRDVSTDAVQAIDAGDCHMLAEVPAP